MEQTPYTYVFVRADIPLSYQIVQACHACLERGLSLPVCNKPDQTSFLILFSVKDEQDLKQKADYLDRHDISFSMFYEPDYDTGYTAICTEPIYGEQRKLFKKFKLWKH